MPELRFCRAIRLHNKISYRIKGVNMTWNQELHGIGMTGHLSFAAYRQSYFQFGTSQLPLLIYYAGITGR